MFATNLNVLSHISLQPESVNLRYFKLRLFDLTKIKVWNIKGLQHRVAKISGLAKQSLWQKLNSFKLEILKSVKIKGLNKISLWCYFLSVYKKRFGKGFTNEFELHRWTTYIAGSKELSLCHNLKPSHPYIFAIWWYIYNI